jgi:HEAT repeat protein
MTTLKQGFACFVVIAVIAGLTGCVRKSGPTIQELEAKEIKPSRRPPPVPKPLATPLDASLAGQARSEIAAAHDSTDPLLRANALEALQRSGASAETAREPVLRGLSDRESIVRFAAAMTAGQLKLAAAYDTLVGMVNDPDPNVRVAVRFALHRMGDTRFSRDLEKSARDFDRSVRANTAIALGLLGEKSALNVLNAMTADLSPAVRLQVAESMWRLGSHDGLTTLVAASVSRFADDQILAIQALAATKDQRVIEHVRGKLTSDYAEVSLAAARAMGELGSDEGYTLAINGTKTVDPRQKAMSAFALGAIGRSDAQPALAKLLSDADPNVRLAAATAILQLKPPA